MADWCFFTQFACCSSSGVVLVCVKSNSDLSILESAVVSSRRELLYSAGETHLPDLFTT